jgi:serine/threonine-protein kinase
MGRQDTLSDGKGRVGTPAYMSPEQLTGVRGLIDEKSDVWGLGAMLFEVLTGRSPRDRGPLHQPPPAVRTLVPECPTDLAALCDKALAEAREARYPSAEALAEDLDAWLHGREVKAHVYRPRELIKRFVTEHRVALTVGLVSLLTLVVLSATAFVRVREERNRARDFGLSMLSDVLPRVTSLGDTAFLSRFTGRVQEWLDVAGSGSDDPSVGRAPLRRAVPVARARAA